MSGQQPPQQEQQAPAPGSLDTSDGFIVGADPAQPRQAEQWGSQGTPADQVSQPVVTQAPPVPTEPPPGFFTREQVEQARQEEKSKLYGRLETMEQQLKQEAERKQKEEEARRAEQERQAAEAKQKEESEMEVRQLLERKETEWNERLQTLEQQREQDRAVFERERQLAELDSYRRERVDQESEWIMPELRDLIGGDSVEAIDGSIEEMKQRTAAIIGNIQESMPQQPQPFRGASPTAPPVGPMEQMPTNQNLTAEDIRTMDIETYKQHRDGLLAAAHRQYEQNGRRM